MLADGRQSDVVGGLDVVVADDRQVVGDMQAELARGRDDAQGLRVAGREDRCRAAVARPASGGQVAGLVSAVCPVADRRRDRTPAVRARRVESPLAVAARGEPERILDGIADEGDLSMAELEQVTGRQRAAGNVVADDARHALDRGVWTSMKTIGTGAPAEHRPASGGGGSDITSRPSVRCECASVPR